MNEENQQNTNAIQMAYTANTLATIVGTKLDSHLSECTRRHDDTTRAIETLNESVGQIKKWIWIATGVMLALSKGVDLAAQLLKHGGGQNS
jgi:hypothetical protein